MVINTTPFPLLIIYFSPTVSARIKRLFEKIDVQKAALGGRVFDVLGEAFENMSLYPNPTNGSVFINNNGSNEVFNYVLTDVNGREISSATEAINGTEVTEVSLDKLVTGFYLIRVFNDNAEKTFRVVKQ